MTERCKKCRQKYQDGSDGYCPTCLAEAQQAILGQWEKVNARARDKKID